MNPAYTPENTQFAFDFHDVVVARDMSRIQKAIFNKNFIYKIHFNRYLPGLFLALANTAYHDFRGGTGEIYIKVLQDYHQPDIAQLALDVANDVRPIEGTIEIIKELRDLGYEINMASDIGTTVLRDLKARPQYQALLALFTHEKSVDYLNASGHPIKKPQLAYFTDYAQKFQDGKQYVIFIDDKEKNVTGARTAGMIGIVFKNPPQLRAQLVKMGILQ
jgi:FMN phosphatase YigB (HAD superfamily)